MKRIFVRLWIGLLVLTVVTVSSSAARLVCCGTELPGVVRQGDVLCAPFRAICEHLGYEVNWQEGQAIAEGEHRITACPGDRFLYVDHQRFFTPTQILLQNDRTIVPVRALCEALGMAVSYDSVSETASISYISVISAPVTASVVEIEPAVASEPAATYSDEELTWLARIVEAEAGAESPEGKLAVANVILNRVASSDYPDTIYDVIFDTKYGVQFEPTRNGSIYKTPSAESVAAARDALEGQNNIADALYFYNPSLTDTAWFRDNCEYVQTIGCHDFYQ